MSESDTQHIEPGEAGTASREAQSAKVGGVWGDPRLSASRLGAANEGSRATRHPLALALGWVGGFVLVVAALILILR